MTTTLHPDSRHSVAGAWLHNPATGEIARIGRSDPDGRKIEFDLWLQLGAAVARAHIHDRLIERFEVLDGDVGFLIGGERRSARAGDRIEVPAGTVHDWWNVSGGTAHVRVEVEATPAAEGRPAIRFVAMIEAVWSLGALNQVDAQGQPDALWLAAIAHEFRDAIRLARPPSLAQAAVIPPLAAVARRLGRDPLAPELHGADAACAIADPGEAGLAKLLAEPVGTRAARGRL